ncbi:uncharacterized protein LOC124271921, partial [Haliotis rubra]|uniref:uncharacterized protein LOC124271921 n=1 Tax=Haliotis rubra TaxID=36100 RepID=UPI001EE58260
MSSSSEMATAEKKARKVNWTRNEMDCLVDEVEKHKSILFSSFSSVVTNSKKQQIWKDISNRSDTRRKATSLKKAIFQTGGGPSPSPLSDFEYKVVSLIPSAQINGCTGGLDSEDLSAFSGLGSVLFDAAVPSTSTSSNNLNVDSARTSPILLSPCTPPRQAAPPTPHDPPASFQLSPDIVSRPGSKKQKTKVHTHEDSAAQAAEVVQQEREKVAILRNACRSTESACKSQYSMVAADEKTGRSD